MFKLDTSDQLLASFRPKDRAVVELPPGVTYPRFVRDYLAWPHPAGGRVFLVFSVPNGVPTGVVFDSNGGPNAPVPQMCEWCHHTGVGTQVALLTAQVNAKKRAGVHLCSDLSCKEKLEDEANRAGRSVLPQMAKLLERIGRFASEALQIDLSGANR